MADNVLEAFIKKLSKLPGLGPCSGRRLALHLIKERETVLKPLSKLLSDVEEQVQVCAVCGNYDLIQPCQICQDSKRDSSLLCVVAHVEDVWALERGETYAGHYHVLGGLLSALEGVRPEDLKILGLKKRIEEGTYKEIIFALSPTMEGQTTSYYVQEQLAALPIKVSRLSFGLPMGGELDYLDEGTLNTALKGRVELELRS